MSKTDLYNEDCITGMAEKVADNSIHLTVTSIPCQNCNQFFEPTKNQRYCSAKCKWTFTNKNRALKPNVIFDCKVCGNHIEKYVSPSSIKSGKYTNEFCSRKCKGKGQTAENHWNWKGGRILEADGYVMIYFPKHPNANNKGYVFEHRLVMEAHIEAYLSPMEVVHHKNGNRSDNRIENLELFASNAEHKRAEMAQTVRNEKGQIMEVNHCV